MRMRWIVMSMAVALGMAHVAVIPAVASSPQRISGCGQVITGYQAYLDQDLTCPSGFVVRFDESRSGQDFTVDLGGHRLRGPGHGVGFGAYGEGRGGSFVGLTVSNGRVDHWGTAFDASSASLNVRNVRTDHNDVGVSCSLGGCTVADSVVRDSTVGVTYFDAELTVMRTLFRWNGTAADAYGPFGHMNVGESLFLDNRTGVRVGTEGLATLTGNRLKRNGTGVAGVGGYHVLLTGNRFNENGDGVYLPDDDELRTAEIEATNAYQNTRYGIYAPGATDLGGNRAWQNGAACVGVVCSTT